MPSAVIDENSQKFIYGNHVPMKVSSAFVILHVNAPLVFLGYSAASYSLYHYSVMHSCTLFHVPLTRNETNLSLVVIFCSLLCSFENVKFSLLARYTACTKRGDS